MAVAVFAWGALVVDGTHWGMLEVDTVKKTSFDDSSIPLDNSLEPHEIVLGRRLRLQRFKALHRFLLGRQTTVRRQVIDGRRQFAA